MKYLDDKYVMLLSNQLPKFKKAGKVYNFRCPYCLDSERHKNKRRGYIYNFPDMPTLLYKCHNCGVSVSFPTFLKFVDANLFNEYIFEKFKDNKPIEQDIEIRCDDKIVPTKHLIDAPTIAELPDTDIHKQYIIKRKIPQDMWGNIYYVHDFKQWAHGKVPDEKYHSLIENDPRILFPFYSPNKTLIGGQGRTISANNKLRYITFKTDEKEELIYGLDRIDLNQTIYLVEGPIDSLFIPNCLACAGSDLAGSVERVRNYLPQILDQQLVLIYDNEPRNKQIVYLMEKAVKNFKVVIWDEFTQEKDINDMILSGLTKDGLFDIIKQRTFGGLSAQLEFRKWRKC